VGGGSAGGGGGARRPGASGGGGDGGGGGEGGEGGDGGGGVDGGSTNTVVSVLTAKPAPYVEKVGSPAKMEATSEATSAVKVPAAPERENDATLVTTVEPALMAVTATASVSVPAAAAIKRWKLAVKVAWKAASRNG
jgi:hypothetical protein